MEQKPLPNLPSNSDSIKPPTRQRQSEPPVNMLPYLNDFANSYEEAKALSNSGQDNGKENNEVANNIQKLDGFMLSFDEQRESLF